MNSRLLPDQRATLVLKVMTQDEKLQLISTQFGDTENGRTMSSGALGSAGYIVVLENNGPVAMPWLDQVGAVLEAWYPGAAGGKGIQPLFPFGYGLSYTRFAYRDFQPRIDHGRVLASFTVTNRGSRKGVAILPRQSALGSSTMPAPHGAGTR